MKRFLPLFAILAILLPATAHAGTKLKSIPVGWKVSYGDNGFDSRGDSTTLIRAGTPVSSVSPSDTSQTIDIRQFVLPGPVYTTAVASDSVAWLRIDIFPLTGRSTASGDTAHVQIQVSQDGRNWTGVVFTGPKISPLQSAMAAAACLETGTTNAFHYIVRQVVGGATQSVFNYLGTGAPTANQIYGFKYMRVISQGDYAGQYAMEVTGFVPSD